MKKAILFSLFVLPLFLAAQLHKESNVVDFYRSLPELQKPDGGEKWIGPPMVEKNDKYYISYENFDDPDRLEAVKFDIVRGYLKFTYDETGGGGITQTVRILEGTRGSITVGVTLQELNGSYIVARTSFFDLVDSSLVEVTDTTLSGLTLAAFPKDSNTTIPDELTSSLNSKDLILIHLPEHGSSGKAALNTGMIDFLCKEGDEKMCEFKKLITRNPIELRWDRRKHRYKLGKERFGRDALDREDRGPRPK